MVPFLGGGDMSDFSPQGIFLSYRRDDTAASALLLHSKLSERFPAARIFMDLDSIRAGQDFAEVIQGALDSCVVLVALIGRQWATIADGHGRRRLDDPGDFVRSEVKTALQRGVRVIPVLVDGARPLQQQELPADLHQLGLARLQAFELSYGRYQYDANQLLDLIQEAFTTAVRPAQAERTVREVGDKNAPTEAELEALDKRASAAGHAGDAAGARDLYAESVRAHQRAYGPADLRTLWTRHQLAEYTGRAGNAAGAHAQFAALKADAKRAPDDLSRTERKDLISACRAGLSAWK
jgi:hypothetical protein